MGNQDLNKLESLRQTFKKNGVDGFIVPNIDEHLAEYAAAHRARMTWLTNFTGSAGLFIVLNKKAALFVDGRYTLQARAQVDLSKIEVHLVTEKSPTTWLKENLSSGQTLSFDPTTLTEKQFEDYKKVLDLIGVNLKPSKENLVDLIWEPRPAFPSSKAMIHPLEYAGVSKEDKIKQLRKSLKERKIESYVTSSLETINWLLNIRGHDFSYLPVVLCHLIVHADEKPDVFIESSKVDNEVLKYLTASVHVRPYEEFAKGLKELGKKKAQVLIDPETCVMSVIQAVEQAGGTVIRQPDPCLLPKACKNEAELIGAKKAHIRDGAALVSFLAWLDEVAPQGALGELEAAQELYECRTRQELFQGLSFATISSTGPNGAIIHYRVSPESNRTLKKGDIYLVDSGGQYLDGTTDVTRSIAIGTPTAEHKDRFTRVLKGHIALARIKFPAGTKGSQLDSLARIYLWEAGFDYAHGTGHGVGSFLSVHEGPQRVSNYPNFINLEPGMILSNEPGYYKEGDYGIRIESLVYVKPCPPLPGGEIPMLCFETLTMAPIDLKLIERSMLLPAEKEWLNSYHKTVKETLRPFIDARTMAWLEEATQEI
jgi:Xaa-Pro aminopeptidase